MLKLFDRRNARSEGFRMTGSLTVKVWGPDGQLKEVRGPARNLIVSIGKDYLCDQIGSAITQSKSKRSCRWTGIGHSSTAAGAAQTKLLSQRARKRNRYTHTIGKNYYSCIATFTSFGAGTRKSTIYESGLHWQSGTADSVMLCRQTFGAVTKLSADTLTMEWRVSFT